MAEALAEFKVRSGDMHMIELAEYWTIYIIMMIYIVNMNDQIENLMVKISLLCFATYIRLQFLS